MMVHPHSTLANHETRDGRIGTATVATTPREAEEAPYHPSTPPNTTTTTPCPPNNTNNTPPTTTTNNDPWWYVRRWVVVWFLAVLVWWVNDLATLIALVGAVGQTGLAALPCLLHMVLQHRGIAPTHQGTVGRLVLNVAVLCFCATVLVAGCTQALSDIMGAMTANHHKNRRTDGSSLDIL